MIKIAKTKNKVLELITNRWSPLSFDSRIPSKESIEKLLEAASWAPSAMNEQPWRFMVAIKGESLYEKLYDCLAEGNKIWAKTAPVLLLTFAKKTYTNHQSENRHYAYDLGQAVAYLTLQASAEGLYIHQMGGYSQSMAERLMSDDDYEPFSIMALGYLGDPENLDEKSKKRELSSRSRKDLKEFVFYDSQH